LAVRPARLQKFDENQNTFRNLQRNYFRVTLFLASYSAGSEIDQLCLRRFLTKDDIPAKSEIET